MRDHLAPPSRCRGASAREAAALTTFLRESSWFMALLEAARAVNAPDWVIGAGAVRDLVWDRAHGRSQVSVKDIDLAFFDPTNLRPEHEAAVELAVRTLRPDVDWDAKNQAAVHLWYQSKFGHAIDPIMSIEDGIGRWPESATAVGVRLETDGALTIIAPLGLADLLGLVLRRNPRQVTRAYFAQRRAAKNVAQRWPMVRVIEEG